MRSLLNRLKKIEGQMGANDRIPKGKNVAFILNDGLSPEELAEEESRIRDDWVKKFGTDNGGTIITINWFGMSKKDLAIPAETASGIMTSDQKMRE